MNNEYNWRVADWTDPEDFSVEAEKSNLEKINRFAEELSQKIMDDDSLVFDNDIEIVEINVDDVLDLNNYDYDEDEDIYEDEDEY